MLRLCNMTRLHPVKHPLKNPCIYIYTSSTAQGGGGSFKNRKAIGYRRGWLLWITDGRANPLMDRKVLEVSCLSLSFALFLSVSLSFSDYLPTYLPTDLSVYLSIYLSIHPSIDLSICLSIYVSLSLYLPTYLSIWRALFRHLNLQKWSEPLMFLTFWLGNVLPATTACTFSTSPLPKVVRRWCVLYILTCKCASRYNGVHFFDISTSKNGPTMVCFVHFDLQMCFAPQRRALFRHLNFQKCSERGVFCTFWLANVLRATTACNFSSLIWPAGSAPAALASLLFDPPEPQIIGKTQCFATFLPFLASASSFFLLFLFYSSFF